MGIIAYICSQLFEDINSSTPASLNRVSYVSKQYIVFPVIEPVPGIDKLWGWGTGMRWFGLRGWLRRLRGFGEGARPRTGLSFVMRI